jgi:hypothetical protein
MLPPDFILPDYHGRSLANVPTTIAALLGAPFAGLPPLRDELWRPLGDGVRRVVLFLVDAMGWNLYERDQAAFAELLPTPTISGQITSVFPSTTVAALSSLWTGVAPARHGMVGLHLFFPEYAVLGQMIRFTPVFGRYPDALFDAGLEPETFLEYPGMAGQFSAAGIPVHSFKGKEIIDSGLSKMHDRGAAGQHGVFTLADMLVEVRTLLEEKPAERLVAMAYWPAIDTLSHFRGWQSAAVAAELRAILTQIQTVFLAPLSRRAREGTVFLLLADHGQIASAPSQHIIIETHPELHQLLLMQPAGDPRTAYLYARQGQQQALLDYMEAHLSHFMTALPASDILAGGLLGPAPHASKTAERIGDVIAIMRYGHMLVPHAHRENLSRFISMHGGLTADEMLVPFLAWRL